MNFSQLMLKSGGRLQNTGEVIDTCPCYCIQDENTACAAAKLMLSKWLPWSWLREQLAVKVSESTGPSRVSCVSKLELLMCLLLPVRESFIGLS